MGEIGAGDVDGFLQVITPEDPCGPNLEYDPAFLQLEEAILGKPEVQYGDTVTPAVPPDWKTVKTLSLELLGRSRDLRVALPLTRALLALQGATGFAAGMQLIEGLLTAHWEQVHPQLDPDDAYDPMMRINTLSTLVEFNTVLREVREVPVVVSRAQGRFSLRDIDIATGEQEAAPGEERSALGVIDAAFDDIPLEQLQALSTSLDQAMRSNQQIESILNDRVGAARSLDLSALTKLLRRAGDFARERLARRTVMVGGVVVGAVGDDTASVVTGALPKTGISGEISNRDDVIKMIDRICAYYARAEPSSPIPLLLQRAQRLVDKTFIEIMQDMTPDGLSQLYAISGTVPNE